MSQQTRKREIILPHELIEPLSQWHSGMDSIYALSSTGANDLVSISMITRALEELERIQRRHPDDELDNLIGELQMITMSPREFSAREAGMDIEEYEFDRVNDEHSDPEDEGGGLGATKSVVDEAAATELKLFIDNDGDLYRSQTQPIHKNLEKKVAKGVFDVKLAAKLFKYLVDNGARKYAKEFASAGDWNKMFSVATREKVAREMAEEWAQENGGGLRGVSGGGGPTGFVDGVRAGLRGLWGR